VFAQLFFYYCSTYLELTEEAKHCPVESALRVQPGGKFVPEWLTTFLSDKWDAIVVGVLIGGILLLPNALISRWTTPNPPRLAWKHRTRIEKLRNKLEIHKYKERNLAKQIALSVFVVTAQLVGIIFVLVVQVFLWLLMDSKGMG
jgi:hypothetical protein